MAAVKENYFEEIDNALNPGEIMEGEFDYNLLTPDEENWLLECMAVTDEEVDKFLTK